MPNAAVPSGLGRRRRERSAMLALARAALSSHDRGVLISEAVRVASVISGSNASKMLEMTPEGDLLVTFGHGWPPGVVVGIAHIAAGHDASPSGLALSSGKAVRSNATGNSRTARIPDPIVAQGITAAFDAPVRGEGRPYGVLQVDALSTAAFDGDTAAGLQDVADLLGRVDKPDP